VLTANKPSTAENVEFHSLVAGSHHNTVIAFTMKTLLDVAKVMTIETHGNVGERFAISLRSHEQHEHLLEAFRKGDSEMAYTLMFDHIVEVQEALRNAILGR
jgi:DNA-binding GntR family transcriptional regulator